MSHRAPFGPIHQAPERLRAEGHCLRPRHCPLDPLARIGLRWLSKALACSTSSRTAINWQRGVGNCDRPPSTPSILAFLQLLRNWQLQQCHGAAQGNIHRDPNQCVVQCRAGLVLPKCSKPLSTKPTPGLRQFDCGRANVVHFLSRAPWVSALVAHCHGGRSLFCAITF